MSVHLHAVNDDEVLADLDERTAGYGSGNKFAAELGMHPTALKSIKSGNQRMTARVAEALGWELKWVRKRDRP